MNKGAYGKELILDIHETRECIFTRITIASFLQNLCRAIEMQPETICFWDYADDSEDYAEAPSHLKGTSVVQFIRTSNITIHILDELRQVYLNIFSCKDFDVHIVSRLALECFGGYITTHHVIERK